MIAAFSLPDSESSPSRAVVPSSAAARAQALAPISASTIDLSIARRLLDEAACSGLEKITELSTFKGLFLQKPDRRVRRSKGLDARHVGDLESWGVAKQAASFNCILSSFLVLKKSGGTRLIINAKPINRIQTEPAPLNLPTVHGLLARIASASFAATVDVTSAFYQFALDDRIARFFTIAISRQRGKPRLFTVDRMPMGWKHAPSICQNFMAGICRLVVQRCAALRCFVDADVWLDNFIFLSETKTDLKIALEVFKGVAAEINLQTHDVVEASRNNVIKFLGLQIHLRENPEEGSTFTFTDEWIGNLQSKLEIADHTHRSFAGVIGSLIWGTFVTTTPLALFPSIVRDIVQLASDAPTNGWDAPFVPTSLAECKQLQNALKKPFPCDSRPHKVVPLYSDSTLMWYAWQCGQVAEGGEWTDFEADIFVKEALAASNAILCAANRLQHHCLHLLVDNSALAFSWHKGHSHNEMVNTIMRNTVKCLPTTSSFVVSWVPTNCNPADRFTRGEPFTRGEMASPRTVGNWATYLGIQTCQTHTRAAMY